MNANRLVIVVVMSANDVNRPAAAGSRLTELNLLYRNLLVAMDCSIVEDGSNCPSEVLRRTTPAGLAECLGG